MWRIANSDTNWLSRIGAYFMRCGDAVSQLVNVLIFFSKNPNESLSGRSYREKHHWFWGKMLLVIDTLFSPVQKEHCRKSHEADVKRASDLLKSAV